MRTLSFVGSDKNAGKTTSFNFVYDKLIAGSSPICITSIGLNGEKLDNYEGHGKPLITTIEGSYFITAGEHLNEHNGMYETISIFAPPLFKKTFVMGKTISPFQIILEGPNEKHEIVKIKKNLLNSHPEITLLIDGSIDRQFIASPEVSDAFYFALLISNRKEQLQKAKDLLEPLSFKNCETNIIDSIEKHKTESVKTILINNKGELIHKSTQIPFMDEELKKELEENVSTECTLYLSGALTKTLYSFLAPYKKLAVVLDNFTLYHNITVKQSFDRRVFYPTLSLFHPVNVEHIFIKEEGAQFKFDVGKVPVTNIFREDFHAIRVSTK